MADGVRKLGDFNGDGTIDVRDTGAIEGYASCAALGKEYTFSGSVSRPVTEEDLIAGDVDRNGVVDINDANHILQYYAISSTSAYSHLTIEEALLFAP